MEKIKVVHLVAKLDRGGVEVWLKEIFENLDKSEIETSFITTKGSAGYFDNVLEEQGAKIFKISAKNSINFLWELYFFLRNNEFNAVHSHLLNFSGLIMFVAWLANVPIRISHSHSDKSSANLKADISRKAYLSLTRGLMDKFATHRLACSVLAGKSLFGNKKFTVIENGVNLKKFKSPDNKLKLKYMEEFGIRDNEAVIGHVGRFSIPKNHDFIIDIIQSLYQRFGNFKVILVGTGELEAEVRKKVKKLGLSNYFIFAGGRDDVPDLMTNLFDVFLFPSLYEGMPISLIETQAAGLQSLISDSIPRDVIKIDTLFRILPLGVGTEMWVKEIIDILNSKVDEQYSFKDIISNSDLNISVSAKKLFDIYNGEQNG